MEYEITPNERLSHEVLLAVSEAENTPLQSLPALSEVVDPDALNELFESRDETNGDGHVSFVFSDSFVSIDYGDCIHIETIDNQYVLGPDSNRAKSLKVAIDHKWLKS